MTSVSSSVETPTPWEIVLKPKKRIIGANGQIVADLTEFDLANAALIVEAVNAYRGEEQKCSR